MKLDLSIGQRLTIGFALMLLVLIGVLISVSRAHDASARAQATYSRQIAPLTDRATALERSVYQVAIGVRDYVITPDALSLSEYKSAAEGARDAMRALRDAPKTEIGDALFREVATLVNWYLIEVDRAVEERRSRALGDRTERALGHARQRALGAIRDFSEFQAGNTQAALAGLANARDAVTRDLRLGSSLAMLCFLGIAFLTARSVRRPVDQILELSRGFQTGLWKPALAWAPSTHSRPAQPRDEMLQLRRALGSAAAALEKREERLYADAQVAGAAAASLEKEDIAEGALVAIVEHVRAAAGAVYLYDAPRGVLQPIATYALQGELTPLKFGQGLPGQAVKSGRPIVFSEIPADTAFQVKLGFEQLQPKALVAVPILFQQEPIGVLLAASLREFDPSNIAFLRAAASQLAVGLRNALAHERVEQLLRTVEDKNRQLEHQNARLQAQNDRIQSQNEEIQAQNEEIQAQNEEIQAQSEEITLQNDQLRANAEELRARAAELAATDERKNRFLGVLAHELRTPLAPVMNALHMLKRVEAGSGTAAGEVAVIERQMRHLEALVEDLSDIGRVSHGKLRLEREPVDMTRVVNECVGDHIPAAEESGVALESSLPHTSVWVDGDRRRLTQIASNLIINAIKFSERGQRVVVAVRDDGEDAVLDVNDEGAGLDPEFLPYLFEPFSQATGTLQRTSGGLGLGLAVVKALVEMHGGRIDAYSAGQGRGARFVVRLPVCAAHSDHAPPELAPVLRMKPLSA